MDITNHAQIIGHVGQDFECKNLESGTAVANFSVATNHVYKNKRNEKVEKTTWHNVVAYGNTAKVMSEFLKKGSYLVVTGSLRTRSWENDSKGTSFITEIVVSSFKFLPSKQSS